MSKETMQKAFEAGASFYDWHPPHGFAGEIGADETMCRLVTSFATTEEDVDGLSALLRS